MDKEQYSICTTNAIITAHILLKNRLPCFAFLFHHWTYYSSKLWLFKENFGIKNKTIFHLCFSFQKKKKNLLTRLCRLWPNVVLSTECIPGWVNPSGKIGFPQTGPYMKGLKQFKVSLEHKHSTGKCIGETAGLCFCKDCLAVLLYISLFSFFKEKKKIKNEIRNKAFYFIQSTIY